MQAIAVGALSKEEEPVSDTDSSDEEGADEALSASGSTASTQQAGGDGGVAAGTDRASWSESGTPSSLELPSELTADISSRYLSEQERKRREEFEKAKNDLSKAIAFGRKSPLVSSAAKRRLVCPLAGLAWGRRRPEALTPGFRSDHAVQGDGGILLITEDWMAHQMRRFIQKLEEALLRAASQPPGDAASCTAVRRPRTHLLC